MATRFMVRAGTVKIGDTLNGRTVTGLGKTWTVDSEHACEVGASPREDVRWRKRESLSTSLRKG